jgi:hypothetical protein
MNITGNPINLSEVSNAKNNTNQLTPKQDSSKEIKVNNDSNLQPKDDIKVSKIPSGKKNVITNLDISDSVKPISQKVDNYINKINNILQRKDPTLELKDKEEIIGLLKESFKDKSLEKLVKKLDKENVLKPLYQDLGTLVNQGSSGSAVSGVLALFTLGASLVSEANQNRAFEMKQILKDANIDLEILNKLDN